MDMLQMFKRVAHITPVFIIRNKTKRDLFWSFVVIGSIWRQVNKTKDWALVHERGLGKWTVSLE